MNNIIETKVSGHNKPRLAIIGAGIAGLTSAWLLRDHYQVTLFERHASPGLGVYSLDYSSNGIDSRIDIPLRIFTPKYYHNLLALYQSLGIEIEPANHTASFANQFNQVFFHYGRINFNGGYLPYPKGRHLFSLKSWKIIYSYYSFFSQAKKDKNKTSLKKQSFGQYIDNKTYPKDFVEKLLLPALATVCTCDYKAIRNYPAHMIVDFITCGIMSDSTYKATKGVDDIIPKLLAGSHCLTHCQVSKVEQTATAVTIDYLQGTNDEDSPTQAQQAQFDYVIVASQPHHSKSMIQDKPRRKLLNRILMAQSEICLHTDTGLLPKTRSNLSPLSYFSLPEINCPESTVNLSKAMPSLKGHAPVFQTWNPLRQPDPNKVIARAQFDRALVTLESTEAIKELLELNKASGNRIFLVGSYMSADKLPLLDAGVDSALAVAEILGVSSPWQERIEARA